MFNDKAIEFETQKYKVKKALARLKEAGLNITKYELLINQIIAQCEKDAKFDETQTDLVIDSFTSNNNIAIYNKAIKALESIYIELRRYDIYLKISAFCNTLKLFLTSPSLEKLEPLQTSLKSLLRDLKNSNTLNYEVEGPLVENIYHLTYEFIKVEIKLLGSSPTLNYLKNDDIHALNLDKQIVKELESLDLKSDQYLTLAAKKYAIDTQGLDNNYLDEDLIATLIRSLNPQDYSQLLEELCKKIENYESELNFLVQEMEWQETTEEIKTIKYSFGKIRKNIVLFVTSASVALGLVAGSVTLSKKIATIPTYETTTTIYDPKLEEQEEPTVKYTTTKNNGTYLCEYQPYVETDSGFKREILTYDVSYLEGLTDDEYFDLDLKALGINPSTSYGSKSRLSLEDLYTESYSVLKKVHVNPEKTDSELVSLIWVLLSLLLICLSILIDMGLENVFLNLKLNENEKIWGFIDSICEIRKHYQNIKASKLSIKEKEEALKVLKEKAYRLYQENQEIINRLQALISEANFNPAFAPKLEQVQNNLSRIRELNKKVQN